MRISRNKDGIIEKVDFKDDSMDVTIKGEVWNVPYSNWPRLLKSSKEDMKDLHISPDGLHFITVDQDMSIDNIINGDKDPWNGKGFHNFEDNVVMNPDGTFREETVDA